MKHFKIKKTINETKVRPFIKINLGLKKPKFPRIIFWNIKN